MPTKMFTKLKLMQYELIDFLRFNVYIQIYAEQPESADGIPD